MTPAPVCISIDADLDTAVALMQEHSFRHLPVMDGDALAGVVSQSDLAMVESLIPDEWQRVSVAEAMSPHPYAVPPDALLSAVVKHMADERIGCAVVRQPEGRVVGLFTTTDALRVLAVLASR
jgi:acetoin utilization protein AcuB